jgi:hypothetical protein
MTGAEEKQDSEEREEVPARSSKTNITPVMRRVDLANAEAILAKASTPSTALTTGPAGPAGITPVEPPVPSKPLANPPLRTSMVVPRLPWYVRLWRWFSNLFGASPS